MTAKDHAIVPADRIESHIVLVRGHRVMLDADLARLYRVSTKRLNEQVKRNRSRFPAGFMFRLTGKEKKEVVANCDHLASLRFSSVLPYAFTEHGAVMLASVLNSPVAVRVSIQVVRAFVKLREVLGAQHKLAVKLLELEKHVGEHDNEIAALFEAIRRLMQPPEKPRRQIGFHSRAH